MIKYSILLLLLLLTAASGWSLPIHLDPQASVEEYQALLKKTYSNKFMGKKNSTIDKAINYGERLSAWLKVINTQRSPEAFIKLTTEENRGSGVPIHKPYIYSEKIVEAKTKEFLLTLPQQMKAVLFDNAPYTPKLEVSDQQFTLYARKIYGIYSMAARYKLLSPSKTLLVGQERRDVRGYHYLVENNIDANKLRSMRSFSQEMINALIKICQNDWKSRRSCQKKVETAIKKKKLHDHYNKYFPIAKKNWDSFFKIKKEAIRKDIQWGDSHTSIPFQNPRSTIVRDFVIENIEDEFRFDDWKLVLEFSYSGPSIEFQKGVTPHVDKLGGNRIVMDANAGLDEFSSQWTLRHEFGHVLGLPDCYHEFYDTQLEAYVNYQIDVTDLMCSRSGNMNERIFQELKKTYR